MAAYSSTNSLFKAGDGASPTEAFATVAQVSEIKWSGYSRKTIEVTVMGQSHPSVMIGSHEPQTVELTLLFDPAEAAHEALRTKLVSGSAGNYQIILPDPGGYQVQFNAYVTKFEIDALTAEGAEISANVTMNLTALPTVTP